MKLTPERIVEIKAAVEAADSFATEIIDVHCARVARTAIPELLAEREELIKTWRCFNCDFTTTNKEEAAAHFGDDSGLPPICVYWSELNDDGKLRALQDMTMELDDKRKRNDNFRSRLGKAELARAELERLEKLKQSESATAALHEEIERLEGERRMYSERHGNYMDQMGPILEDIREHRHTGEPAQSDFYEVRKLRTRAESVEKALEAVRGAQPDQPRWTWWEGLRDASINEAVKTNLINHRGLIMNSFDAGWAALCAILNAGKDPQ